MTRSVGRRTLLVSGAAAIMTIGSGAAPAKTVPAPARSADAAEAAYAKLLAQVHDDYVNGRVVEHQGWILSMHEFDLAMQREQGKKASTS